MRVSLVLGTKGRTVELSRFLDSLAKQSYSNFELIVVDQNLDDRLIPVLSPYETQFQIIHLRSDPGLSRARNVGIQECCGDLVAFPDDDCCYPADLLEKVVDLLKKHPDWDGVTGCPADPKINYRSSPPGRITLYNAWHRGVSYTIFLRHQVVKSVGGFDETLGVGANTPWGGSEEIDYLIRAMQYGFNLYYESALIVQHPGPVEESREMPLSSEEALNQKIEKVKRYSMGDGRVLAKRGYPFWFVIYQLLRPFCGAFIYSIQGKFDEVRIRLVYIQGKLRGWLGII